MTMQSLSANTRGNITLVRRYTSHTHTQWIEIQHRGARSENESERAPKSLPLDAYLHEVLAEALSASDSRALWSPLNNSIGDSHYQSPASIVNELTTNAVYA